MTCTHHWMIDPPAGKTSAARCKRCGAKTEMANSFEVTKYWRQTIVSNGKGHGLSKRQLEKKIGKR